MFSCGYAETVKHENERYKALNLHIETSNCNFAGHLYCWASGSFFSRYLSEANNTLVIRLFMHTVQRYHHDAYIGV
jgi:hypothetical protein